jgi:hypothetical protein
MLDCNFNLGRKKVCTFLLSLNAYLIWGKCYNLRTNIGDIDSKNLFSMAPPKIAENSHPNINP